MEPTRNQLEELAELKNRHLATREAFHAVRNMHSDLVPAGISGAAFRKAQEIIATWADAADAAQGAYQAFRERLYPHEREMILREASFLLPA